MAVDYAGAAGPYAGEVAARLRYYPHEIEADLRKHYGVRIVDWWRHAALGDDDPAEQPLTGREVLALLDELPDYSRFRTESEREGDWPEFMYLLAGGPNETKMLRKDGAAYRGREMSVSLFESPRQKQDRDDGRKLSRAAHDHLVKQMSCGANADRPARNRRIVRETDIDQKRAAAEMRRKAVNHG
ncbi:MAG TPA: hypothetical protein VGG84_00855 [Gemmatimonadaceae bacterium]